MELDEGPRLLGRVESQLPLAIGAAVVARFEDHSSWTELYFGRRALARRRRAPAHGPGRVAAVVGIGFTRSAALRVAGVLSLAAEAVAERRRGAGLRPPGRRRHG